MAPPSTPSRTSPGLVTLAPSALAVLVRPWLWATALHLLRVLAAPGWWRSRPHVPLPPPAYWRFRMVTAYGDPDAAPVASDLVTYLGWCRQERRRRPGRWPGGPGARSGGSVVP